MALAIGPFDIPGILRYLFFKILHPASIHLPYPRLLYDDVDSIDPCTTLAYFKKENKAP